MIRVFEARQNGGKLEIDQAEAPVGLPVGDVPGFGVVMAHTVGFQLRHKFLKALVIQMLDAGAAIRSDNLELSPVGLEKPGHKRTASRFKITQNPHLIIEPFLRFRTAKGLVNAPVETEANLGPERILYILHSGNSMLYRSLKRKRGNG